MYGDRKHHIVYVPRQARRNSNDGWSFSTIMWLVVIIGTLTAVISRIGGF